MLQCRLGGASGEQATDFFHGHHCSIVYMYMPIDCGSRHCAKLHGLAYHGRSRGIPCRISDNRQAQALAAA